MLLLTFIALVIMFGVCIYQSNAYKTRTDTIGVNCFFTYFLSCFVCAIGLAFITFRFLNGI
jgi:TRAP-type C4-dicarboxylate transport system permease small subunit